MVENSLNIFEHLLIKMIYHHILFSFETTKNPLTHNQSEIIESFIRKNCKNLQYKIWSLENAKNFMQTHYPQFADIFNKKLSKPIILCDFFRYVLMYHFGGVYTDLDFLIIRPFDDFLKKLNEKKIMYYPNTIQNPSILLSEEWLDSTDLTNTVHNGILITLKQKHPFWLKLMHEIYYDIIIENKEINTENDVYITSGPKKLYKYYSENNECFKDVCILPYYYCCPFISEEYDLETDEKKIKLFNNACWKDRDIKERNWKFFNINDHENLKELCPNSFFVNVFLNMGSMWK